MHPMQRWSVLVIAFAMLAGVPGGTRGGTTANPEVGPQSMAMIEGMATVLAEAKHFSVTVDIGYDVVQNSGQQIEFAETRTIVMRRPDHICIEAVNCDRSQRGFIFNGRELVVFDVDDKLYATLPKSGTVDEVIDYDVEDDDWDDHPFATGMAVAAGASRTAAAFRFLTCPPPVTVAGVPYYQCDGTWYSPAYQGGNVTYVVVNPPPGY